METASGADAAIGMQTVAVAYTQAPSSASADVDTADNRPTKKARVVELDSDEDNGPQADDLELDIVVNGAPALMQ